MKPFHNMLSIKIVNTSDGGYRFDSENELLKMCIRDRPWGTAHAILSCKDMIDGPFAVINADDYYGREAFKQIYDLSLIHI